MGQHVVQLDPVEGTKTPSRALHAEEQLIHALTTQVSLKAIAAVAMMEEPVIAILGRFQRFQGLGPYVDGMDPTCVLTTLASLWALMLVTTTMRVK